MSAVRLVKPTETGPDLSAFSAEQQAQLLALEQRRERRLGRIERVIKSIFRGCIGVAREIEPDRRWDGL